MNKSSIPAAAAWIAVAAIAYHPACFSQAATVTPVYTFSGYGPYSTPIRAADGSLYGAYGNIIYKVTQAGVYTAIYQVPGNVGEVSRLIQGGDGNLYAVAPYGGPQNECGESGCGSVFSVSPQGKLVTEYDFCPGDDNNDCAADEPTAPLTEGADGEYYGTAGLELFKVTSTGSVTLFGAPTDGGAAFLFYRR
jgi:hypothetical protein